MSPYARDLIDATDLRMIERCDGRCRPGLSDGYKKIIYNSCQARHTSAPSTRGSP